MLRLGVREKSISNLSRCTYPFAVVLQAMMILLFVGSAPLWLYGITTIFPWENFGPVDIITAVLSTLIMYALMCTVGSAALMEHPKTYKMMEVFTVPIEYAADLLENGPSFKCKKIEIE